MKTCVLLLTFLCLVFQSYSQKVKIKDDIVTVDGTPYIKWEKGTMGMEASIMPIDSNSEEVFISYQDYSDPSKISSSNPEGKVRWVEVNFLTQNLKCEVKSRSHKSLAKLIYENEIYVDGVLTLENVEKFVQKYGSKFSDNRPTGGNVNIIINN